MDINIKQKDCKFIVKPEERMVICIIESHDKFDVRHLVSDFIFANSDSMKVDIYPLRNLTERLDMPSSFIGKAVCAPEDEWDEALGRKIAYFRAKHKLYTSFFKRANLFINTVDRELGYMMDKFNNLGVALQKNHAKLEQDIDEQINK